MFKNPIATIVIVSLIALTVSCADTTSTAIEEIIIEPEAITLTPGETKTVDITIIPDNASDKTIVWSNSNVFTIDGTSITASKDAESGVYTLIASSKSNPDIKATLKATIATAPAGAGGEDEGNPPVPPEEIDYPWRDDYQYTIDGSSMHFYRHFTDVDSKTWDLIPSRGTPIIRVYYLIIPEASLQSSASGIINSFTNRYRDSFPKSFGDGEAAYTSSLSYFQGLDFFGPSNADDEGAADGGEGEGGEGGDALADEYSASYSFAQDTEGVTNGYYITMNLNGTNYRLGRMNGEPFSRDPADYTDEDDEFLPDDADGLENDAILRIYVTASFAFEDYTTRHTIVLSSSDYAYSKQLFKV